MQLPSPYHLFASRRESGLCCAVRQDRTKPTFLTDGAWEFQGCITDAEQAPSDLNLRVANASINLTGYHIFITLRTASVSHPLVQEAERIITVGELIPYIVILYGLTIVIALLA